jgi:hypothetical protein
MRVEFELQVSSYPGMYSLEVTTSKPVNTLSSIVWCMIICLLIFILVL